AAASGRCRPLEGRPRASPGGCTDRAHAAPLTTPGRLLALDPLDTDRRERADLFDRSSRDGGEAGGRGAARKRTAIPTVYGGRDRSRTDPARCVRCSIGLECRSAADRGLYRT